VEKSSGKCGIALEADVEGTGTLILGDMLSLTSRARGDERIPEKRRRSSNENLNDVRQTTRTVKATKKGGN